MEDFDAGSPEKNFFRHFTKWRRWRERREIPDGHGYKVESYAGVYLLAHFTSAPKRPASHLDDAIIYIGDGSWLRRRWEQFEASALHGLPGHSGGHSYRDRFGAGLWDRLHVAVLPIWFGKNDQPRSAEEWTQVFRLYVERRILWELTIKRGGTHGLLNKK